ncbi:hypothetical protein HS7_03050 [Sulfolobales archaeon HS-7]|nr:hypothetical protein HS7_03050 [Sulfolobales archaeon HS-7]
MSIPLTPSEIKKSIAMRLHKYIKEIFVTAPEEIIINNFRETELLDTPFERGIEGLSFDGEILFPLINGKNIKLRVAITGFISDKVIRLGFSNFGVDFVLNEKGDVSEIYPEGEYGDI